MWSIIETVSICKEPKSIHISVRGVDPPLSGRTARAIRRRYPRLVPTIAKERRQTERVPTTWVGLAAERLQDYILARITITIAATIAFCVVCWRLAQFIRDVGGRHIGIWILGGCHARHACREANQSYYDPHCRRT